MFDRRLDLSECVCSFDIHLSISGQCKECKKAYRKGIRDLPKMGKWDYDACNDFGNRRTKH